MRVHDDFHRMTSSFEKKLCMHVIKHTTMWPAEIKILNMSYRGIEELITQVVDDDNIVDTGWHGLHNPLTKLSGVETWEPEKFDFQH